MEGRNRNGGFWKEKDFGKLELDKVQCVFSWDLVGLAGCAQAKEVLEAVRTAEPHSLVAVDITDGDKQEFWNKVGSDADSFVEINGSGNVASGHLFRPVATLAPAASTIVVGALPSFHERLLDTLAFLCRLGSTNTTFLYSTLTTHTGPSIDSPRTKPSRP